MTGPFRLGYVRTLLSSNHVINSHWLAMDQRGCLPRIRRHPTPLRAHVVKWSFDDIIERVTLAAITTMATDDQRYDDDPQ
jgi:hypothetical protein